MLSAGLLITKKTGRGARTKPVLCRTGVENRGGMERLMFLRSPCTAQVEHFMHSWHVAEQTTVHLDGRMPPLWSTQSAPLPKHSKNPNLRCRRHSACLNLRLVSRAWPGMAGLRSPELGRCAAPRHDSPYTSGEQHRPAEPGCFSRLP